MVTPWLFNVAMGHHHFLMGKSSKIIYKWTSSIAMLDNQVVNGTGTAIAQRSRVSPRIRRCRYQSSPVVDALGGAVLDVC